MSYIYIEKKVFLVVNYLWTDFCFWSFWMSNFLHSCQGGTIWFKSICQFM